MNGLIQRMKDAWGTQGRRVTHEAPTPIRRPRQFQRFAVKVPACASVGGREIAGTSMSVGLGGLFLACPSAGFAPNTSVLVRLAPGLSGSDGESVVTRGKVAYTDGKGMGIRFTGLTQGDVRRLHKLFASSRTPKTVNR